MPSEDRISGRGSIICLRTEHTSVVRMENGHCVVAHIARDRSFDFTALCVGDSVMLEMTPYDMSQGRIISKANIL